MKSEEQDSSVQWQPYSGWDSKVVRETIEGQIAHEIVGENGFGYDPIFYVPEYGCTTAEMTPELKNELSHRGKALRAMKKILEEKFREGEL